MLDAFCSTWSDARSTLGESEWTGSASDAYATANDAQGRALGQLVGLEEDAGLHDGGYQ